MKTGIIDIESSGLLSDMLDYTSFPYKLLPSAKMWCVVIRDYDTDEIFTAVQEEITKEWFKEVLLQFDVVLAHNGIKFDFIVLQLFGLIDYKIGYLNEKDLLFDKEVRFVDTLILSRLSNPDRLGGHSLHAWGLRTNNLKIGFRELCIADGTIEKNSPKGAEFLQYSPRMLEYCIGDTSTNSSTYSSILQEMQGYDGWKSAVRQEHKLADLAVRRETFGFWFNKKLALELLEDLTEKMTTLTESVNPKLPLRPLTKVQLSEYTPPKTQTKADGSYSTAFINFVNRVGGELKDDILLFDGQSYQIPILEPLRTNVRATIDDLNAVKMHLIDLGWNPTEWRERDLTKDSKKINLPLEKRVKALKRWCAETIAGKYKKQRLEFLKMTEQECFVKLRKKLNENKPVRVPTSPSIRVGVEKELCPHLIELGEEVSFAKEFSDYLTYKHRKSTIAGGDIEDMDFDAEIPNTGFLAMYREQDGRIPTPAIEIGASTHRYRHIGVANVPRATSTYGKQMRSLFGCGEGFVQLGFDFSSLENRVQGSYVFNGTDGELLATRLIADKPNDLHTINAEKLGITRTDAKSFTYAILYGASAKKVSKMLNCNLEKAEQLVTEFWDAVPALNELKKQKEAEWIATGKKYIRGIDGRKVNIRSQHSILNALFQSGGVIATKYTNILIAQKLENAGYNIDCFKGKPDVAEMISYHDEEALAVSEGIIQYQTFETENEGKEFIKNWKGLQLGELNFVKTWYVALPNPISKIIIESVEEVGETLSLNVPLGIGWAVGKNWYQTH